MSSCLNLPSLASLCVISVDFRCTIPHSRRSGRYHKTILLWDGGRVFLKMSGHFWCQSFQVVKSSKAALRAWRGTPLYLSGSQAWARIVKSVGGLHPEVEERWLLALGERPGTWQEESSH